MRIDIANNLHIDDTVYNCCRKPYKVAEKKVFYGDHGNINHITLSVKDDTGTVHVYDYEDLYTESMEDESDMEKMWVKWASNNQEFLEDFDHLTTVKEIYAQGFADGLENKIHYSYLEQMQK